MKNFAAYLKHRISVHPTIEPEYTGNAAELKHMSRAELEILVEQLLKRQTELALENERLVNVQQPLPSLDDDYTRLLDFFPLGYLTMSEDGVLLHANRKATEILGAAPPVAGKTLEQFIARDDYPKLQKYCATLTQFPENDANKLSIRRRKAFRSPIELQGRAVTASGRPALFLFVVDDLTQRQSEETMSRELNLKLEAKVRRQNEELVKTNRELQQKVAELAQSKRELIDKEAKLNSIFNAAVEGIITIDDTGIIESVNAAVTAIFGYGKEELLGRHINLLMPSKNGKRNNKYLNHYLNTHKSQIVGSVRELQGKRNDGSLVPIDLSLAEFEIDHKTYYTGILRDATNRKFKEQKDKEHLAELAHVTRLGLMGEMASGIAHEVNQPLTAIANYTQACLNFLQSTQCDRLKIIEILNKANEQAIKAGQIVHRMREFVRSRKIHPAKTDINELVKTTLALCQNETLQLQIKAKTELADSLPTVFADFIQIEQVLLNLIRNSIEALQALPTHTQKLLIIKTCLTGQNQVMVSVKDNGPGFDDQQKRQVFTPFYTTKSLGMGMGLSISRSIIEAHNGVLRLDTKYRNGAKFYFTLPVS